MKTGKRIPISDAKNIGTVRGYTQVIIVAIDSETGVQSVCTWGKTQNDCEMAAVGGNFVKRAIGWPDELCEAKPARQVKRENLQSENKKHKETLEELRRMVGIPKTFTPEGLNDLVKVIIESNR
jgi:hypothetical protein